MISHFIFPRIKHIASLNNLSSIPSLIIKIANEKGIESGLSEKTLRKVISNPESVTASSLKKYQQFILELAPSGLENIPDKSKQLSENTVTLAHLEWLGLITNFRYRQAYPQTITYIELLLEKEAELLCEMKSCMESPDKAFLNVIDSELIKDLISDIPDHKNKLLSQLEEGLNPLVDNQISREWLELLAHALINLVLRILAYAEIERLHDLSIEGNNKIKSYVPSILPKIHEDGSLVLPLKKVFKLWKQACDFRSWDEMAETMLGDADVEDKTRKLKGWVAGEHRPDDQTIYDWWQLSLKKRVVGYHCEAIGYDLFKISAFLDKLIIDVIKNPYLEFDSVFIFDSFQCFNRHYTELQRTP